MKQISNRMLREFATCHADAARPLQDFRHLIEAGTFLNFAELRASFASVNKVGKRYVFNIGGNKYRLIAAIAFSVQTFWVKAVLTHGEYDQGDWQ